MYSISRSPIRAGLASALTKILRTDGALLSLRRSGRTTLLNVILGTAPGGNILVFDDRAENKREPRHHPMFEG
jgi:hypothetical protein